MKSKRPKPGSGQASDRDKCEPKAGMAEAGAPVEPMSIADEPGVGGQAPAPGLPVSQAEYERMKRRAATTRTPPSQYRQEDPSGKK